MLRSGQLSSYILCKESLNKFTASSRHADGSIILQSDASSLRCNSCLRCSVTSLKNTCFLSGFVGRLGETMTERWSDRTRLSKTARCFHKCGQLVKSTSKILSPRVGFETNCFRFCWVAKSLVLRWLTSPAIMMRALGSRAREWAHKSLSNGAINRIPHSLGQAGGRLKQWSI